MNIGMLFLLSETAMTIGAFWISGCQQLASKYRRSTTLAATAGADKKIRVDGCLDRGLKTANRLVLSDDSIPAHWC